MIAAPRDEAELAARLRALAGRALGDLAAELGVAVPQEARRGKGWAGQLVERALGATAGSRAKADFEQLGIELKTVPLDARGAPVESCFVASLDLHAVRRDWEESPVRHKLRRVAWLPIEAEGPLPGRRCLEALLWSPSAEQEARLRDDYEDIVALLDEGLRVTAHHGVALQLRPKGRDGADLRRALDEDGAEVRAAPRAFYLRRAFVAGVLGR